MFVMKTGETTMYFFFVSGIVFSVEVDPVLSEACTRSKICADGARKIILLVQSAQRDSGGFLIGPAGNRALKTQRID